MAKKPLIKYILKSHDHSLVPNLGERENLPNRIGYDKLYTMQEILAVDL